jgi:hypothetical protein
MLRREDRPAVPVIGWLLVIKSHVQVRGVLLKIQRLGGPGVVGATDRFLRKS